MDRNDVSTQELEARLHANTPLLARINHGLTNHDNLVARHGRSSSSPSSS